MKQILKNGIIILKPMKRKKEIDFCHNNNYKNIKKKPILINRFLRPL